MDVEFKDNEKAMHDDIANSAVEMLEACGYKTAKIQAFHLPAMPIMKNGALPNRSRQPGHLTSTFQSNAWVKNVFHNRWLVHDIVRQY